MTLPRKLGDFEVQRRIGSGGMAEVFLATKRGAKGTEKRLVVKRLLPEHARSDRLRTMFIHEAHLAMRLAHPSLVHVYELADAADGLLLSMEYVDGADLGRILTEVKRRGAALPIPVAMRIVEQAARGLHHAHEYRDEGESPLAIVHRDISPQNLLVSRDGLVKVADLGVASARIVRDQTGVQPGKLRYMSPEQARGEKVDRRCDVYALGIVLYEMLRLTSPYGDRRGAALARAVTQGRFEPPLAKIADLPPDVRAILERALAADPALRTPTARELADSLSQAIFARGVHIDDAAVAAALAPFIDAAGELPAARSNSSGALSDNPISANPSSSGAREALPPDVSTGDARDSAARVREDLSSDAITTGGDRSSETRARRDPSETPAGDDALLDEPPTVIAAPRDRRPPEGRLLGPRPGDAFDRYILDERIGRGGMAEVFRARDTKLGRDVALKLLRPDGDGSSRDRMLVEAQAAATFEHPGSVVVFDVGEHDGVPFIAMELIRGRTLTAHIALSNAPLARRLRWSVAVARVLAAAHRAGLVHRDVKPSNVMLRDDGEVKVLDFGVVRRRVPDLDDGSSQALTATGAMVGTPGYAAPEQMRGDPVDGRADQFAWAVTTYELLSGRRPWTGESTGVLLAQVLLYPFVPLREVAPDVPAEVAAIIERALSTDPDARFPSMDEAADALLPFCEPDPLPGAPRDPFASSPLGISAVPSSFPPGPPPSSLAPAALAAPGPRDLSPSSPARPPAVAGARPSSPAAAATSPLGTARAVAILALAAALGGAAAFYFTRTGASPTSLFGSSAANATGADPLAPAPVISSIRCAPATVVGDPDPELARALGIGACARLAVDLGIPWSDAASPTALDVHVTLTGTGANAAPSDPPSSAPSQGPAPSLPASSLPASSLPATARVDLTIAGRTSSATAREPLRAVELAAAALAPKLAAPALSPQEIKAWGAADEAGARRIARVFRRRELRISADIGAEAVRLLDTDPDSPFSHLLVLMISAGGRDMLAGARDRVLERVSRLPPSREHVVRGLLFAFPVELDRKEAARLLRQSYAEAPDDHEMVSIYVSMALRLGLPEAFGVLDRLVAANPTRAIVALDNAIVRAPDDDVARAERYAARWADILPEGRASAPVVQALLRAGKLTAARSALDLGARLGLRAMGEPLAYDGAAMDVELAALGTARAREIATTLLADPRPYARTQAAEAILTAHFLDGHVNEAFSAVATGEKIGADAGDTLGTARLLIRGLAASRWLARPAVTPAQIDWLTRTAAAQDQLPRAIRAECLVELALATKGPSAPLTRSSTLEALEAEALAAGEDRVLRDDLTMKTIPLVRAVRGDEAAAKLFRDATRARPTSRVRSAIDAALAFESLKDTSSAARAYASAADPATVRESGLERVIAAVRLHRHHATLAPSEAALRASLEKSADPGLIEAIEKMK